MEDNDSLKSILGGVLFGLFLALVALLIVIYAPQ